MSRAVATLMERDCISETEARYLVEATMRKLDAVKYNPDRSEAILEHDLHLGIEYFFDFVSPNAETAENN